MTRLRRAGGVGYGDAGVVGVCGEEGGGQRKEVEVEGQFVQELLMGDRLAKVEWCKNHSREALRQMIDGSWHSWQVQGDNRILHLFMHDFFSPHDSYHLQLYHHTSPSSRQILGAQSSPQPQDATSFVALANLNSACRSTTGIQASPICILTNSKFGVRSVLCWTDLLYHTSSHPNSVLMRWKLSQCSSGSFPSISTDIRG